MVDPVTHLRETRLSTEATRLIHSAAAQGDVAQLERLLSQGAEVNAREPNNGSSTPLHAAAKHGHLAATNLLLQHGALPTLRDARNSTPLQVAKHWRNGEWKEVIEALEESPAATKASPAAAVATAAVAVAPDARAMQQQVRLASADVKLSILRMLLADPSVVPSALSITALRLESKLGAQNEGGGELMAPLIQMPLCCAAPRKTPSGLHRGDFAYVERPT